MIITKGDKSMEIPTKFKSVIKKVFYDKAITLYGSSAVKEADGWTKKGNLSVTGTFKGNVNFANIKDMQEQYGIKEDFQLSITTDENILNGQVIGYAGVTYKVIEAKPFDSHTLLFAQKWSSRLSTSISA